MKFAKLSFFLIICILPAGCIRRVVSGYPPTVVEKQKTQGAINALTDDQHVQELQSRIKLEPKDVAARLELARIYEAYRLYSDAFEQYAAVLHLEPSDPVVIGLARCAQASGRIPEAIRTLEDFVKASPTAIAFDQLGMLYETSGDAIAGEKALKQGLALDAGSDRLRNNLGYNLLLQKKMEAAEVEFRAALALNPKSPTTHNNLGMVLARRGDIQGALEQFEFAGDAATAHNNLAVALFEAGQFEQSRDELIKALTIRQYFAPALENFKLVQERIRERAESVPSKKVPEDMQ